jgi:hypothetical protein
MLHITAGSRFVRGLAGHYLCPFCGNYFKSKGIGAHMFACKKALQSQHSDVANYLAQQGRTLNATSTSLLLNYQTSTANATLDHNS